MEHGRISLTNIHFDKRQYCRTHEMTFYSRKLEFLTFSLNSPAKNHKVMKNHNTTANRRMPSALHLGAIQLMKNHDFQPSTHAAPPQLMIHFQNTLFNA